MFTSPSETVFINGQSNTFTVSAGPYIDRITATGVPSDLSFKDNADGTATLNGSPLSFETAAITFTASNSKSPTYKAIQMFNLLVGPSAESLPTFTSPNKAALIVGKGGVLGGTVFLNSFLVTTSGSPAPVITAALPPASLSPNTLTVVDHHDGTATVSGVSFSKTGNIGIALTATGAGGATFAAKQTLTVAVRYGAPVFTSPSETVFIVGQNNAFTVMAGPDIDKITATEVPSDLNFKDNRDGTATLYGTPLTTTTAAITFTASNSKAPTYKVTQTFNLFVP